MTKPRLKGFLLLLLGATTFVALGFTLERNSSDAMVDFKAVYFGTRCLLQHGDPYKESDLLRLFLAEDREPLAAKLSHRDAVAVNVNLPTAFPFIVPFAILPWGAAHLVWMLLTAGTFILAACLMWELGAAFAPGISGGLLCLLLAGSELLIEVGNVAGIVVSLCAVAAWCFLRERFAHAGVLCLAIGLLVKPHDAGLVWLYFLLTGGLSRKRALQTLLLVAILGLPTILWVSHVAPNWMEELHSNMLVSSALGGVNDPGPAAIDLRMHGAIMIDLQTAVAVFVNDPRIYNPATYLLCAPLLLAWGYVTLQKPSSPANARLALAAIVALSMLPLYHRQHDTRLLLLAIPACAMLWVEGGLIAWLALLFTGLATVFTWDFTLRLLAVYTTGLRTSYGGLLGKILTVLFCRPAPLILLTTGIFYLWVYVWRVSGPARTVQTETSRDQPPLPPLRPDASRVLRS
jgi:hypothetical protein